MNFELPLDATWLTGMIAYADAATECGDARFAEPLLEQLAPFSDQWLYTDVATSGPVSRSLGDLSTVSVGTTRPTPISPTRPRPVHEPGQSSLRP